MEWSGIVEEKEGSGSFTRQHDFALVFGLTDAVDQLRREKVPNRLEIFPLIAKHLERVRVFHSLNTFISEANLFETRGFWDSGL